MTDPTNQTTTYQYDSTGRVQYVTNSASQQTQNTYDVQGRLASVITPDTGGNATTSYTYDIFDNLRTLTDPEGTVTTYDYDEYNRVKSEKLGSGASPYYTIGYSYVGDTGGGCGSCGGGSSSTIAARMISDNITTQTIAYNYDLLGRLVGMQDSVSNNPITYTYAGTKLIEINHGVTLWVSHKLKYEYDGLNRLAREIYPNGRSIDFDYDAAGRLTSVKDPFGYVNTVNYDSEGRLGTISHSTLGTATFTYDANDRLSRLMLGNGAYTDYGRDTYGRLTSFDIKQADNTRIMKHEWQYDNLGRKSAAAGITVTGPNLPSPISFSYDAASRVTHEALNNTWSVDYGYDRAGNRTSVNDGTISRTMGYGVGNRETSVSDNISPLGYDYKGNVVSRMTLDGTKTFQYGWDAYDRLISAVQGTTNVYYDYDAQGRLLRRTKPTGTTAETTINYWLGLNKIAEERVVDGADAQIWRPDSEQGTAPTANGWCIYSPNGNQTLAYATDSQRGKVLQFTSVGNGTCIVGDRYNYNYNPNYGNWGIGNRRKVGFWFKNSAQTDAQFNVYAHSATGASYVFAIHTVAGTDYPYGTLLTCYVGDKNDGNWHYIEIDIDARYYALTGLQNLTHIDGMCFTANDKTVQIDDLRLFSAAAPLEIFRPDTEIESTPASNGWLATGTLNYATDSVRGKVLHCQGGDWGSLIIGDDSYESLNPNDTSFNDTSRKHLGFWIKNADPNHIRFQLRVHCVTAHYGYMMIDLVSEDGTDCAYKKFIGSGVNDGAWHYVEVDLGSFVASQEAGDSLLAINGLEFNCYAYDLYIDDIILSGGELERSYAMNYLGAQTGSTGAKDVNSQTQCVTSWDKYYYHFNDLRALLVTTTANGVKLGSYESDFFGNSRCISGAIPDNIGMYRYHDNDVELYYFKARSYDSYRGRFISKDPSRSHRKLNLYEYVHNDPVNYIDPDGRDAIAIGAGWALGGGSVASTSLSGFLAANPVGAAIAVGEGAYLAGRGIGHIPIGGGKNVDCAVAGAMATVITYFTYVPLQVNIYGENGGQSPYDFTDPIRLLQEEYCLALAAANYEVYILHGMSPTDAEYQAWLDYFFCMEGFIPLN